MLFPAFCKGWSIFRENTGRPEQGRPGGPAGKKKDRGEIVENVKGGGWGGGKIVSPDGFLLEVK